MICALCGKNLDQSIKLFGEEDAKAWHRLIHYSDLATTMYLTMINIQEKIEQGIMVDNILYENVKNTCSQFRLMSEDKGDMFINGTRK